MVSRNLTMRLKRMESGGDGADATLVFENGSTAAMQVRDALGLCLDAMRNESARMDGQEPEQSKYAGKLALLARAERIETGDGLLSMAFDVCKDGAR